MNFMKYAPLGVMMTAVLSAPQVYGLVAKSQPKSVSKLKQAVLIRDTLRPELSKVLQSKNANQMLAVQRDRLSGAIRLVSGDQGLNLSALIAHPDHKNRLAFTNRAHEWLAQQKQFVGDLGKDSLRLDTNALLFSKSDQFLKFRVYRDGQLLSDAVIDLRFKFGVLVQVMNMSFSEAQLVESSAKVNTLVKMGEIGFKNAKFVANVLRVKAERKSYSMIPADRFVAVYADEPVVVDMGKDGQIVAISNRNHYLSGQVSGDVYRRYYKEDLHKVPFTNVEITANAGSSITADEQGNFEVAADVSPFIEGLRSATVDVQTSSGTLTKRNSVVINNNHDLYFNKMDTAQSHEDKDIAQNMIFYHTNLMVDYAKKFIDTDWFKRTLVANANLSSSCNAHWDGTTINFYSADDTCANTGLISDVVYHEWGHGLDENTGGIEDGAYSEGFGDIMSLIMTRSNLLGIGFGLDGSIVRDLEPDLVYPKDQGEVHHEGLIIAGTFFDLYRILAEKHGDNRAIDLLSNYAFKGIVAASRYTDLYDALLVIDDNDSNLENGSPNFCSLNEAFTRHGLAEPHSRCLMGRINQLGAREINGNGNGIFEPGETISLQPILENNTDIDLDMISANLTIDTLSDGLSLDSTSISWDNIARNTSSPSREIVTLSISERVACGTAATLKFAAKSTQREAKMSMSFVIGLLKGVAELFTIPELPIEIPDEDSVSIPFTISGDQWGHDTAILKAHLKLVIEHTYSGDLKVELQNPKGESIDVAKGSGSTANLKFDADISSLLQYQIGVGGWNLIVTDGAARDVGSVKLAELTLTPANFVCEP